MSEIGVTFEEFGNAFKDETETRLGTLSQEDFERITSKIDQGGIATKEELAMFFAFVLWESAHIDTTGYGEVGRSSRNGSPNGYDRWRESPDYGRSYLQLTWLTSRHNEKDRMICHLDHGRHNDDVVWDMAFWFWLRKCHDVAKDGFWAVLSKVNMSELTSGVGQDRFFHYKNVAQAFNVNVIE